MQGDKIAGVILEPVVGNMGCVLPTPEFRKTLRDLTRKYGAVLIYDEVMTGFRVSYGGAQAYFGDDPDLTTMGKVIGGGDEITIICKAEDALNITTRYFELLDKSMSVLPNGCGQQMTEAQKKNTACAGICVIHAKSPFTVAYEIAEAACENAKKEYRKTH